MSNLKENFKKIIDDLDNHIENKKDLDYIKTQIYNISMLFMDELDKMSELNLNKMNKVIEKHKELNDRMQKLESTMNQMEKEFYVDGEEDDELSFEIICPYCNAEFEIDISDNLNEKIKCPECNNEIELDWNQNNEECNGHCCDCDGCNDENCDDDNCNCEDDDM